MNVFVKWLVSLFHGASATKLISDVLNAISEAESLAKVGGEVVLTEKLPFGTYQIDIKRVA